MLSGTASGAVVNSGTHAVYGSAVGTAVKSGGHEFVYSGAAVSGTTVSSGGAQNIYANGAASATTVSSGGAGHVLSGGAAGWRDDRQRRCRNRALGRRNQWCNDQWGHPRVDERRDRKRDADRICKRRHAHP